MSHDREVPASVSAATRSTGTRDALIELAAEMFSENGYIQTSIRDIARRGALTSGAIYGQFRNKADLLAEAINISTERDLDGPSILPEPDVSHVETLRRLSRSYPARRRLRALIIQGAAAAHTDPETKARVRDEQSLHLDDWIARYEEHRDRLGIDPSLDVRAAVTYTWAAELGLGVLEAFGMDPGSPESWADMAARFGRAMTLPPHPDDPRQGTSPRARKGRAKPTR